MILTKNHDQIGILSSTLCLIHCLATPFVFVAKSCTATCCKETPLWWMFIDFLFLAISFIAVFWSSKNTTKNWIRVSLWVSWTLLLMVILNEHLTLFNLPKTAIYFPAFSLVILHFTNRYYCKCNNDDCCVTSYNSNYIYEK